MADEVEPNGPAATDLPIVGNENLKPPEGAENDGRVPGTPTTAMCARSVVVGTSAGNNNKKLTHVCGFIDDMSKNIYLKKFIKSTAQSIRESIRAILKTLGLSDKSGIFAAISAKLKEAARWLKTVQKFLKDVINFEKYVLAYITKLRAIIAWILSLPARFLRMLAECLAKFLKLVKSVMTDFFKELTASGEDTSFSDLISSTKSLINETVTTVKLAGTAAAGAVAIAGAATVGLLVPASAAEVAAANKTISTYNATLPTTDSVAALSAPPPQKKSTP